DGLRARGDRERADTEHVERDGGARRGPCRRRARAREAYRPPVPQRRADGGRKEAVGGALRARVGSPRSSTRDGPRRDGSAAATVAGDARGARAPGSGGCAVRHTFRAPMLQKSYIWLKEAVRLSNCSLWG